MTGKLIRLDQIDVPPEYERDEPFKESDATYRSIKAQGVLDPINVLALRNGRFGLIKGSRRVAISKNLGLVTVPAVIDELPADVEPRTYQDRLRFILDEHAQDLFPSQRSRLIGQLMSMFDMQQKDVASYLGVDAGTITNWRRIEAYHPDIIHKIDVGELTLHSAYALDDVPAEEQPSVYRKHKREFSALSGRKLRKMITKAFPTQKKPSPVRASRRRVKLTRNEKDLLSRDLNLKEVELEDGKEELQRLNREITLATPPIRAILRDAELMAMLPPEVKPEFERFAEIYV